MIRYRAQPGNGKLNRDIVLLGLTDENLTRLRAGMPIRIKKDDPIGLDVEVVLFHGATEVEMARELEQHGLLPEGSTALTEQAMKNKGEFRFGSIS